MKRPDVAVWVSLGLWCAGSLAAGPARAASPAPPDEALGRKAEHYAVKASLGAALKDFASEAGVTVRADWKALEKAGVTSDAKVAVDVASITWRQVLEVMLSRASRPGQPLAWRIDGPEVVVSTQRAILAAAEDSSRSAARLAEKPAARQAEGARRTLPGNLLPSVSFENLAFRDTLTFFQTVTGANFHINWRALDAGGVRADTPISLNVKGVSIARAMDLVMDQVNADRSKLESVYWVIDGGVVLVSTGNDLNRNLVTRVIDAGGVLLVQPDTPGPRIDLEVSQRRSPTDSGGQTESIFTDPERDRQSREDESYSEQKKKHAENVVTTIKTMIGPDMWEPEGRGSIRVINNKLVISQTLLGFKLLEKALR